MSKVISWIGTKLRKVALFINEKMRNFICPSSNLFTNATSKKPVQFRDNNALHVKFLESFKNFKMHLYTQYFYLTLEYLIIVYPRLLDSMSLYSTLKCG